MLDYNRNPYDTWSGSPNGLWGNTMPQLPNTNVLRVTSLDEAIMKTNSRNSEMVYFHQTKDEFYIVRVDSNGNKSWQTFPYTIPNLAQNVPVMRADFDNFVTRLEALEAKFKEVKNEPDGQNTVQ